MNILNVSEKHRCKHCLQPVTFLDRTWWHLSKDELVCDRPASLVYPEAEIPPETVEDKYREALSSLLLRCIICGTFIHLQFDYPFHHDSLTAKFVHTNHGDPHVAKPHLRQSWDYSKLRRMGYIMGMNGHSLLENPFNPGGILFDAQMVPFRESQIWYDGWQDAQIRLGTVPNKPAPPVLTGLDYLEEPRE